MLRCHIDQLPPLMVPASDWPGSVKPVVVITVGYASDPTSAQLPASHRRPLTELARWL
jgi:hypothetical protein